MKRWNRDLRGYRLLLGYFLIVISLLLLLCSCSPRVIYVPEVQKEYITKTDSFVERDSIYFRDSIYIKEKGDSVFVETFKIAYRDRWREVLRVDTVIKTDSIVKREVVEVEKSLTWWERQKIAFGELAMVIMLVILLYIFIKYKFFR